MPVKPLPRKLIDRLKADAKRGEAHGHNLHNTLGRMENIDHRRDPNSKYPHATDLFGYRVRQMNIKRNFPGVELVLKRTHGHEATTVIRYVEDVVREHNSKNTQKDYTLLRPNAYAVAGDIIAMSKTNAPSVDEIVGRNKNSRTARGRSFFEKLSKEHNVTLQQIRNAADSVRRYTNIRKGDLLVIGFEKGKLLLMPLLEIR